MSKYTEVVLSLIDRGMIKSTNQIRKELEERVKKTQNWHVIYVILARLENKGLIKRIENNAGLFWTKV